MSAPDGQNLPPKEMALFKQIFKLYETKSYKKAIKCADQILSKNPDHGETLSMKGLVLSCQGKKEEAYDLARRGLRGHVMSHVCWHVYGLMHRTDRNYVEAIKSYTQALRIDRENQQILKDLALLQLQTRELKGYLESRRHLLSLKSSNKGNWIALANAFHLIGSNVEAVSVLEAYESTLTHNDRADRFQYSEYLLYKSSIHKELGQFDEVLSTLERGRQYIVDKVEYKQERANAFLELGIRLENADLAARAVSAYRELIDMNPENVAYHYALHRAAGVSSRAVELGLKLNDPREQEILRELYRLLQNAHPKARACQRIPLVFLEGEDFLSAAGAYVLGFLRRGIPSIFSDILCIYRQRPDKVKVLEEIVLGLEEHLRCDGKLPDAFTSNPVVKGFNRKTEGPGTYMWVLFYLANHFRYLGEFSTAMHFIDRAILHTPTCCDLYLCKGRILKHAGDPIEAARVMDIARKLDLQDRYLNNKTVRYMLRSDRVEEAVRLIHLFARDPEGKSNLKDMQVMWFEVEKAESFMRTGDIGKALKLLEHGIFKHMIDMVDDQFDFHQYCLRRMTLRAYVAMLKNTDRIWDNKFYRRAACDAIDCYVRLFDDKARNEESSGGDVKNGLGGADQVDLSSLSAKERKKLKERQKKAAKREAEAEAKISGPTKATCSSGVKVDDDPFGLKLTSVEDPLGEAERHVNLLQAHAAKFLMSNVKSFEVYIRRGKLLLALRTIRRAEKVTGTQFTPEIFSMVVRLYYMQFPKREGNPQNILQRALESGRQKFTQGKSFIDFAHAFRKECPTLAGDLSYYEMLRLVDPTNAQQAASDLLIASINHLSGRVVSFDMLQVLIKVHKALTEMGLDINELGQYSEKCAAVYPYSRYFGGSRCSAADAAHEVLCAREASST